jgi:Tol biopolymer transport system component
MPLPYERPLPFVVAAALVAVAGQSPRSPYVVLRQGFSQFADLSQTGCVSHDGRFVAFASGERLLPADSNRLLDIYVYDRERETLTLETLAFDGASSNGGSGSPALSADGGYLVFDSDATNLTRWPDDNGAQDVFLRDRVAGSTRRVSVSAVGHEARGTSRNPTISGDGRIAAYVSNATNLTGGPDADSLHSAVYLVRLDTGDVNRASTAGLAYGPRLSNDGRSVTFTTCTAVAPAAQESPGGSMCGVFVRDIATGVTNCISCSSLERAAEPHLSGDGRLVVFTRISRDAPGSPRADVVLHDRTSLVTSVITRRANANSGRPRISGDGRFIVFQSQASNLECEPCPSSVADRNLLSDIYLFDREAETFKRISGPESWWVPSVSPWIDGRGRVVVFSSRQPLGPGDSTTDFDLFVWSADQAAPAARVPK